MTRRGTRTWLKWSFSGGRSLYLDWLAKLLSASVLQTASQGQKAACNPWAFDLTDIASMAWRKTADVHLPAGPARVGGLAQSRRRSYRHRLPPRTDDSIFDEKRTDDSQNPGHATHSRTLEREASAINDWRRCPRGPREHTASGIGSGRCPRTLPTKPTRFEAAPSTKQRLPKPTPSPRRRDTDHDKRWTARRRPR